jgi:RHS repeat-associated protein
MPDSISASATDGGQAFQVPYLISDQPDGTLPDMQGFDLERVGSAEGGWYSLCPIKADRDLVAGETLSACLVHRRTGELTRIDYTAKARKLGSSLWVKDFAREIAAAGQPITAGAWNDSNAFSGDHAEPRLWCQADYRAFSTAPFNSNLVQVLACNDSFSLEDGKTLSLQVRDLKTQALHEQHLFTATADSGWSQALCKQVNRDSRLLRAGVKSAGCTVTPGEAGNAFWGPQCAELCVTLTEVDWWASRVLDSTQAVPDGGVLHAWVYDTFSQRLLGHHQWTPSSTQRAGGKWLKAWAAALATSEVAPYLRVDTTTAMLEQRGDALRIFARLPGDDYDVEGPLLASAFKAPNDAVLVTVRHPGNQALLHHALFRPQTCAVMPSNEQSWLQALASFIETQQWPELYVKEGRQLWLLRHAELQVALENVGDGSEWEAQDYRLELLSADQWPQEQAIDPTAFTVEPGEGMTGVTISSLGAELQFRLDKAARDKGYRVMACVPRQSAAKQLREAYNSYVDAAIEAGRPVALSFAEAGTLTAAAAAAAVVEVTPESFGSTVAASAAAHARSLIIIDSTAVLRGTEFVDTVAARIAALRAAVACGNTGQNKWGVLRARNAAIGVGGRVGGFVTQAAVDAAYASAQAETDASVAATAYADAFAAAYAANFDVAVEYRSPLNRIALFAAVEAAAAVIQDAVFSTAACYAAAAVKLVYAILAAHKEAPAVWPVSVTSDTITWQGPLANQAYDLYLDCPTSERGKAALVVGHIGTLHPRQFWQAPKPVSFTPPKALKPNNEISFLCEDYGYTHRSELFDTNGHGEAGVDPRTGLFHAHYPVASLQGLRGQGPVLDLTLHYSALRANEAGLGDGWAWRFSSVDVRAKLLTLADGAQVQFTDEQWTMLGKGEALRLVSCVVSSNPDYSEFTLDLPSGRQEVLKKPAAEGSDEEEPNKSFHDQILKTLIAIKNKSKPDFPAQPENWQQWVTVIFNTAHYYMAAQADYDAAIRKWHTDQNIIKLDALIADYQRPFVLLVPSTIKSPYGEALTLEWKRQKGQFLLLKVKSGDESLFEAKYVTPQSRTAVVKMKVWSGSKTESYEVRLELKDYLLRKIQRVVMGSVEQLVQQRTGDCIDNTKYMGVDLDLDLNLQLQLHLDPGQDSPQVEEEDDQLPGWVLQQVDCDYDDDPTLDRVLCSLRELDGSVEFVKYQADEMQQSERPGLPRVVLHTLVPGAGQENQVATYHYDGDFLATDQRLVSVEYELGPHGAREQHLLVHGNVMHGGRVNRFELLRGVASEQGHWLDFCTRQNELVDNQYRKTKGYRYTGAGDEFAKLLYALKKGGKDNKIHVEDEKGGKDNKTHTKLVQHQQDLLRWFISKSNKADRPKLAARITRFLASYTLAERETLGRSVEVATHFEDLAGNELLRCKGGEHKLYRCYYYQAGENPFLDDKASSVPLKSIQGLESLPTLSCPAIPRHASAPVMAEYQCDPFGNFQGLRLFGYREVTQGGRKLLQQSEVLTIEGIKIKDHMNDHLLDASADWTLADAPAKLLWRQRSTTSTPPTRQGSESSKVMRWTVEDIQATHEITGTGENVFTLSNCQEFVDNPNNRGIVVRIETTTKGGTQELSKELRARHSRRLLEQVAQGEEVHWIYDALGRVILEERYTVEKNRIGQSRGKGRRTSKLTSTQYSQDGQLATHTHADESISRSYLDGVQRVWRREWCKQRTQGFVPLAQYSLQGLGASQVLASCEWDYLPGGQAVVVMTPAPSTVGPQAWVREQGGLDGPGMRSMLQALRNAEVANAQAEAPEVFAFEPYATEDITSQRIIEEGLDEQRQSQRTIDYTYRKNGTFEQVEHLVDGAGQAQLQVRKRFDNAGDLIGYERTLDTQTRSYALERDAVGRVTKVIRPDNSVVEYSYHGLSTHVTQLKVDGKVVATQSVENDSTLSTRTVGSRAYRFVGNSVTLPDSTRLTVPRGDQSQGFEADEQPQASPASDNAVLSRWAQVYRSANLPGQHSVTQTSPRDERQGYRWLSLRGRPLASLRADGHWQRVFSDEQDRVLRTCQDHEEVVYRYDALGRLQSRQAQALKSGGQWWVLSEYDGLGQEVTRRFLYNGIECFRQCLTWQGDGRLANKTSYEHGVQVRVERFTYDALDRLTRYDCEASAAEHCPRTAQGEAVKAQVFTWDALSNLTRCVTTGFDDLVQTEELAYGAASDPTRLTGITNGGVSRELTWNSNGYLTNAGGQHRFSYNAAGQLDKVRDSDGNVLASYEYDDSQRLAAQYLKGDESTRELRYDGDELIGEIHYDKDAKVSRTISLSSGLAQYDGSEVRWLIDDLQVGVAGQFSNGRLELAPLLPFGEGTALAELAYGYNGMRRDPLTGHYHAGNGYRCYHPELRRYAQPDWLSPFGEGGFNDYVHCPDPVNLHDPSGAIMLSRWGQAHQLETYDKALKDTQKMPVDGRFRGLAFSLTVAQIGLVMSVMTAGQSLMLLAFIVAMSVASFSLEVAALLTENSHPEVSRWLSVASVATGVLSCLGFFGLFKAGVKTLVSLSKMAKTVGKVVWSTTKAVLRRAKTVLGSVKALVGRGGREVARARRLRAIVTGRNGLGFLGDYSKVNGFVGAQNIGALGRFKYNSLDPAARWLARQGLGGAVRQGWNYLKAPVQIAEQSSATLARSGWLGTIGRVLTESIHTPGTSRGLSYATYGLNTALEANMLKGTIETSEALDENLQASGSVRGGGIHVPSVVPKLPSLRVVQHSLLATISVRFW